MAVVKGSKQERMIVVPYRPLRAVVARVGVVLCMLVIATGGYFFGHSKGISENIDARLDRDRLQVLVENFEIENSILYQEAVNNSQASEVNGQALDEVRETILALRETNAQLEEDVLFYKQVMSPESSESGLMIGQLDLLAGGDDRTIRYRIEFKQASNTDDDVEGYATVSVLGLQDGQEISIPLRSLSDAEDQLEIGLAFKYFQNIEGELVLPENFTPEKIQIMAVAEGSNAKTIQKSFAWLLER